MDKNSNKVEPMKRPHGGARPGGGKPKGVKWPSTLRKEEAREKVRQFITERLGEFLEAMADNVLGIRHLMMRDRLLRVTDSSFWPDGSNLGIND